MQNKKKTKSAILIKHGKTIFNEVDFRVLFEKKVREYPVNHKQPLTVLLRDSLKGQSLLGGLFVDQFKKMKGDPYTQYYYYPVLASWRETQSLSHFSKTSDYCARALPGTTVAAQDRARQGSDQLVGLVEREVPIIIKGLLNKAYERLFANRWEQFGGALLPLSYLKGTKA